MITGIGVDIVDVTRFARSVERTPALIARLFAESERTLPSHSLAARFAAKEALIKALGGPGQMRWLDMEVVADDHGNPEFRLHATAAERAETLRVESVHLSMTHDAGVACAFVVVEGKPL